MNKDEVADLLHQIVDRWEETVDIYSIQDGTYGLSAKISIRGDELELSDVDILRTDNL